GKEGEVIDTDDRGRQCGRGDARVKSERNWKDVGESGAAQNVKRNQPTDCNLVARPRGNRRSHRERMRTGYGDRGENADLGVFVRREKFLCPDPPKDVGEKKKT